VVCNGKTNRPSEKGPLRRLHTNLTAAEKGEAKGSAGEGARRNKKKIEQAATFFTLGKLYKCPIFFNGLL